MAWVPVGQVGKGQRFFLPPALSKKTAWGDHPWAIEDPSPPNRPGWVEITPHPWGPGDAILVEGQYYLRKDIKVRICDA